MGWHVVMATVLSVPLLGTYRKAAQHLWPGLAGLASPLAPYLRERQSTTPWTGDVWARLCGEWAARKGESLAGMGWEGEEVSVELHSCWPCLSPSQKHSSARHGNSPASPVCCEHVLITFSAAPSCLSRFPCC